MSTNVDEQLYNELDFYASPKTTSINLKINNSTVKVGNAIVCNLEESNSKIPVYSYNSSTFSKFLSGKRVVTGALALRKTTISQIISAINVSLLSNIRDEKLNELSEESDKIGFYLTNTSEFNDNISTTKLLEAKISELTEQINQINDVEEDSLFKLLSINDTNGVPLFKLEGYGTVDLLNYSGNTTIELEVYFSDNIQTTIKDILFIKKVSEINVGRTDIVEMFQFIGNPGN